MTSLPDKKIVMALSATIIGIIALGSVPVVHAVSIATTLPGESVSAAGTSPGTFVNAFYTWALSIAGVLAFGIIVYGGVKYMISSGNSSSTSDAKEWIKAALFGILLLAGAYFILNIINPNLVNLSLPTLNTVEVPTTTKAYTPPISTSTFYCGGGVTSNNCVCVPPTQKKQVEIGGEQQYFCASPTPSSTNSCGNGTTANNCCGQGTLNGNCICVPAGLKKNKVIVSSEPQTLFYCQ